MDKNTGKTYGGRNKTVTWKTLVDHGGNSNIKQLNLMAHTVEWTPP